MKYDMTARANNNMDMSVYFSSHAIERIGQRISGRISEVTRNVSFLLLNSCAYLDDFVKLGEEFFYIIEDSVFVCKYGPDDIFVITAYRITDMENCIRNARRKKVRMVLCSNAYAPCA